MLCFAEYPRNIKGDDSLEKKVLFMREKALCLKIPPLRLEFSTISASNDNNHDDTSFI